MQRFPRLHAALDYAAEAHQNQVRKGTSIAYLSHLLGVAGLVIEHGGDEDQAIAGLLHDILEDCGLEHAAPIGDRFGERVLGIVQACTDGTPDASGKKAPWRERKVAYLAHLTSTPVDALLVSACDKLHNARAIATDLASGEDVFARFTGGRDGTLWYYRSLVDAFADRLERDRPLVVELAASPPRARARRPDMAGPHLRGWRLVGHRWHDARVGGPRLSEPS
jgi:(p)ppGpp synthase/HD superfamily hydrolase